MNADPFDPYIAQARYLWLNQISAWRAHAAESGFSALAWCAGLALLAWIALSQLPALRGLSIWLVNQHPWPVLCGLVACLAIDHWQARRALRQRWASDWLSAQPIAQAVIHRRRLVALMRRSAWQLVMIGLLLAIAKANALQALMMFASAVSASAFGNGLGDWFGDYQKTKRVRPRRRETPFTSKAVCSISRWQWIEAGASLAPRQLAPLLLVILLVPRGPAAMVIVALALVLMAGGISAWLRAVRVIVHAERWLVVEPIAPTTWLPKCLFVPLTSLCAGALMLAALMTLIANTSAALLAAAGLMLLGTLYIAIVASGRKQPQRIALRMTLHLSVLAALAQALLPLLPVVFGAQLYMLIKRSLRP